MKQKRLILLCMTVFFVGITGMIYCFQWKQQGYLDVIPKTERIHRSEVQFLSDGEKQAKHVENAESIPKEERTVPKEPLIPSIYVHLCGQVQHPGVYKVKQGTRLIQVIKQAGGFTKQAARDVINQAKIVTDEEQIEIPSKNQMIQKQSMQQSKEQVTVTDDRVNINTATKEQLMTLPGIGQAKAERIIDYRTRQGAFTSIEQIKQIEGIKEKAYEKIKDKIII